MNYLLDVVISGLQDTKAKEIAILDLSKIQNAVCSHFVICHGTSSTHVSSIAENLRQEIKNTLGEYPWRKEGIGNGEWVILDYSNIVVHVFMEPVRRRYQIEELWADAEINILPDEA